MAPGQLMTACRRSVPICASLQSFVLQPAFPSPHHDASDALTALRRATRSDHERVDRLIDVERLRDPAHYARVLQVLDAFLAAWEPAVAAALPAPWKAWLQARSRRGFLRHDLAHLGLASTTPAALPPLSGGAAAWGAIYVMEGSALGGQFIARSLQEAGLHQAGGASYFRGWGAATGGMWREVRGLLEAQLDSPAATAQACEAARQTFQALSNLLESQLHERTPAA